MTIVKTVMAMLFAGPTLAGPSPDGPDPELLFARAREAVGPEYRRAREAFLASGPAAEVVLRNRVAAVDATEDEKWLASSLLRRIAYPDEFARMEAEFARLVYRAYFLGPSWDDEGIRVVGRLAPPGPDTFARSRGMMGEMTVANDPHGRQLQAFRVSLKLSPSVEWKAMLGEVVMKGWTARADVPPSVVGGQGMGSARSTFTPEPARPEDHLIQAMHVLSEMGESRAVAAVGRIVADPRRPARVRAAAAESLGWLRAGLECLLNASEDPGIDDLTIQEVFWALRRLNDPGAITRLERLAARPAPPPGRGRDAMKVDEHLKDEARMTLEQLRGEVQPQPD